MIATKQRSMWIIPARGIWGARITVGLALISALSYVMLGLNVLTVGDLQPSEAPAAITYVCAGSYLLGGLLILLRMRWLWIVGAVVNAMVMLIFFAAYMDRSSVIFSPGGLVTKAAELLLEVGLIYIIITGRRRSPRGAAPAAQAA